MEKEDFIRLVLPDFVIDNFDALSYSIKGEVINIELDEKHNPPIDGDCKFVSYELSHYGTSLSKEFVAFLKEYHRE